MVFFGSWSEYGGSISSYRDWRFYQGFDQISEPEFLTVTGFPEKAKLSQRHHDINTGLVISSCALLGAALIPTGLGIYYSTQSGSYSILDDEYWQLSTWSTESFLWATIISTVAAIPVSVVLLRNNNWMPLELAAKIADEYNSRLK